MLIEFSVDNYKSIKEKVTLSMVASNYYKNLENNLISLDKKKNEKLLRSSVIFGANASGKTNVIHALNVLQMLVLDSHKYQKGDKLFYKPFKLDDEYLEKPTKFEIIFIQKEIKYKYFLSCNGEKIIEEKLYYFPKNRISVIFERTCTDKFEFSKDKTKQKFIAERTLDNVLYLSNATKEKYELTTEAFNWFKEKLHTIGPADHPSLTDYTVDIINSDDSIRKKIMDAIEESDFGIKDISSESEKLDLHMEELPDKINNALKTILNEIEKKASVELDEKLERTLINTYHKGISKDGKEKNVKFDLDEESEGTRRMFSLIGSWIVALLMGKVIIADELDTKLHHYLQTFLIKKFNNPKTNLGNGQLIFTSHNFLLLDQELFRRDQIWFTDKNHKIGSTDLYSLTEFSERNDKDILKAYMSGRYGGIPFIIDKSQKVF